MELAQAEAPSAATGSTLRQRRGGGGDARAADAPPRTPSTEDGETRATSSAHASAWLAHACSRLARPVTDWMTEYNRLLSRAHDLDAAERALCESSGNAKIERRSHRRSPLEAFRDVRSVLMNPSKRQLFSMTFAVVPLPLLAFIALMSMIRPYASLKRTALLASLSETLINSATAHASTVLGTSAGSAAPAAFLNGTNAAAAVAAPINDSSSSSSGGGAFAASDAWSTALSLLAWYIGLFVLEEVADLIQLLAGDTLRYVLEFHGRMTYLSAILVQDAGLIDTRTPAELQQRMAEAPSVMQSLAMMPPRLLQFAFTFGCGLYNMLTMDPLLTLATWLLRLPITLNLTASNHSLLRMHSKLGDDVAMRAATQAAHCITDRRTIQLHAAEEWELHRYGALLLENYHTRRVLRVWEKVVSRLSTVLHLVVHCSTLAVAVTRIAGGYITVPAYRAFESYQHTTANSFENLMHELSQVRTLVERSEIAFTWHYRKPKILAPIQPLSHDTCNRALDAQLPAALRVAASARGVSRAATLAFHELKFDEVLPCADASIQAADRIAGRVEFSRVTFHYPAAGRSEEAMAGERPATPPRAILSDVSFVVQPGQRVAFVGRSGSGKSTLFRLLCRIYDVDAGGAVLIDGRDVRAWDARVMRAQVAMVEQDPALFPGSVRENLTYGIPLAQLPPQSAIEDACRRAHIHATICALPDGYDTLVGARGVSLSGGERQRVAIARALLRNPAILLLDEATAALDAEAEAAVKAGIEELMRGRTVLMIAHRLHTVKNADVIHVVNEGRIVESGTHAQLVDVPGGIYRMLVRHQRLDGGHDDVLGEEADARADAALRRSVSASSTLTTGSCARAGSPELRDFTGAPSSLPVAAGVCAARERGGEGAARSDAGEPASAAASVSAAPPAAAAAEVHKACAGHEAEQRRRHEN